MNTLNPVYEGGSGQARQAPALSSLEGTTIGLLDNNKKNTTHFLNHVEETLREHGRVKVVVRALKHNFSAPAPDDVMNQLLHCDAVITATGD